MTFTAGEKCFAKVKGFPPWPARINVLPPDVKVPRGKYPIFFYGTYEVCFLPSNAIFPYEKFKKKYGAPRSTFGFNKGLDELENNSTIFQYGFDPEALKFLDQFYDFSSVKKSTKMKSKSETTKKDKQGSHGSDLVSESSSNPDKSPVNNDLMSPPESESKDIKSPLKAPNEIVKSEKIIYVTQMDEIAATESKDVKSPVKAPNEIVNAPNEIVKAPNEIVKSQILVDVPQISEVAATDNLIEMVEISDSCDKNSISVSNISLPEKKENVDKKFHIDEYANDFTNLLLEIRKYSWSKPKTINIKQSKRKSRIDARIRLFYPWYDSTKKK